MTSAEQERAAVVADLPKAGFIYDGPPFMNAGWKPRPGHCRASVADGGGWVTSHQCNRKAKVTRTVNYRGEAVELGYCNQHDPVRVEAKDKARWAEWEAKRARERAAAEARRNKADLAERAIEALRQIAAGHNDPRTLAQEILAQRGEHHGGGE